MIRAVRWIALALIVSALASLTLFIVYRQGGQPQLEGALLGVALGGISAALVLWSGKLLPQGPFVEERDVVPSQIKGREQAEESAAEGAEGFTRRGFLTKLLITALGALGLASVIPIRSLGLAPGRSLFKTAWRRGSRLVRSDGSLVTRDELGVDGIITVFPEGHTDAADAQAILIRLPPTVPPPGPRGWSVDGFVAFSKICTHAGCPIGLYEAESKQLFCPCHQSVFSVLEGAEPIEGPAARPLPQLPLTTRGRYLVARGDFEEPVGPGFWNRGR
ncbi:MAG: Rieske 2Fe-2S domain-containing protein [Actinomycetota bacterium]